MFESTEPEAEGRVVWIFRSQIPSSCVYAYAVAFARHFNLKQLEKEAFRRLIDYCAVGSRHISYLDDYEYGLLSTAAAPVSGKVAIHLHSVLRAHGDCSTDLDEFIVHHGSCHAYSSLMENWGLYKNLATSGRVRSFIPGDEIFCDECRECLQSLVANYAQALNRIEQTHLA